MPSTLYFLPNSFASNFFVVFDDIQISINNGEDVTIIGCGGSISHCEMNLLGSNFICNSCAHSMRNSLNYLKGEYNFFSLSSFNKSGNEILPNKKKTLSIYTIKDLKELKYNEFDVGYSVASTYISMTRNHNPLFSKKFLKFISHLYFDSMFIYMCSKSAIEIIKPDLIKVFNGRLHTSRPIVNIAEKIHIKLEVLEVVGGIGEKPFKKVKYINSLPHNIENNTSLINDFWDEGDNNKEMIGKAFFEKRKKGIIAGDKVYIKGQINNLLPDYFDINKKNIAIFISSDDEMASIGKDWEWSFIGGNQLNAIKRILSLMENNNDYYFYVRIHPNLSNIKYSYHTVYHTLENSFRNIKIISADSPISSYALIDACNKVITFGSSIGIEATFWGKPSILIGKAIYMHLNVTYNPTTEDGLFELITDEYLKPKSYYNSLKYGYYINGNNGENFIYFNPNQILNNPKWINRNLFLFNLNPKRKIDFVSIVNFINFSLVRFLNHFIYYKRIPLDENI